MPDPSFFDAPLTTLNQGFPAAVVGCVGAIASAFFGAWMAARIAEKGKLSEQLLAELRSTNAALTIAFSVCNVAMAFKRQHARPLYGEFVKRKAEFIEYDRKWQTGERQGNTPFRFEADLRLLQTPAMAVPPLETQVYDKISIIGRPLALVAAIAADHVALSASIQRRNDQILQWNASPIQDANQLIATYFGTPIGKTIDQRYSDTLKAISDTTDNLIFFSELLCLDLMKHAEGLQKRAPSRKVRLKLRKFHKVDFSQARTDGLMPDHAAFSDWLRGFVDASAPSRWERFKKFIRIR